MYKQDFKVHFVGIGGVGMAGIAEVLLNLGYSVSGSDVKRNALVDRLSELGAAVTIGHSADHVTLGTGVVVVSSAVRRDNPELVEAERLQIPIIPRAEMLAELMRMKYGIAIAGSHGKTTTTSMTGKLLSDAGLDPTVIIGGRVLTHRTGATLGRGPYLVAEADESDGSFNLLRPAISIVTNIDSEHLGHYGSFGALESAFHGFMSSVPFYGLVIACLDDPVVARLAHGLHRRVITYGLSPEAEIGAREICIEGGTSTFTLYIRGEAAGRFTLPMPGSHMVSNSLSVVAVGLELGIPVDVIGRSLSGFPGVARRSEVIGTVRGITIIDDYAHHPTELAATLRAIRAGWKSSGDGRLIALFQPHRYSRTRELFSEFVVAFNDADEVVVSEIYPAGEEELPGVTGEKLAHALQHERAWFCSDPGELVSLLAPQLREGDVVVTLGAGNIGTVGARLRTYLEEQR